MQKLRGCMRKADREYGEVGGEDKEVQKTGQGLLHAKIWSHVRDMAKYEKEAVQALFLD